MDRIEAYFAEGVNEVTIDGLTQHDKDVLLHISGDNIPDFFELHMDYYGRASAMRFQLNKVDGVATIKIPNELLKQRKTVRAWVYVIGSEGCRTKKTILLPLIQRNKADDVVSGMEEDEKDSVEQLIEASNKLVKGSKQLQDDIKNGVHDGAKGDDGKSAYEYAKEGGYTGTEEEFSSNLARVVSVLDGNEVAY